MTDSTNTTKEEPKKAGKSFFFDFVNQGLGNVADKIDDLDGGYIADSIQASKDLSRNDENISAAKEEILKLLVNRIEKRKADRNNSAIERRIARNDKRKARELNRLEVKHKLARIKAFIKTGITYDPKEGFAKSFDKAAQEVDKNYNNSKDKINSKYDTKNKQELAKVSVVESRSGSVRRQIRIINHARANNIMTSIRKDMNTSSYLSDRLFLGGQHLLLKMAGYVTSPVKFGVDGVKHAYEYVTDPERVARVATKIGEKVAAVSSAIEAGKKARNDAIQQRRERRAQARKIRRKKVDEFKKGVKGKWTAGINFARDIVEAIGTGAKTKCNEAWKSITGCYRSTVEKATTAYNNSTLVKIGRAVRTGYNAGRAAYLQSQGR